jgi:hypothetical protein
MATTMLSGCGCLIAGTDFSANTNIHESDIKIFRTHPFGITYHLPTPELLGHHTSLRQHEETQASIQQQIEKG